MKRIVIEIHESGIAVWGEVPVDILAAIVAHAEGCGFTAASGPTAHILGATLAIVDPDRLVGLVEQVCAIHGTTHTATVRPVGEPPL